MRQSDEDRDRRASISTDVEQDTSTVVPRPDPTALTTRQLEREISALSEIFEAKLRGLANIVEARLLALTERVTASELASKDALTGAADAIQKGLDKAEKSIVVSIDKVQNEQRAALTDAEKRVNEKFEVMSRAFDQSFAQHRVVDDEKFRSIETQFTERDKRTEQLSLADKTAIAAALQAQKEAAAATNESNAAAIAKSEVGFEKRIEQIYSQVAAITKSFDDKINDLKSRLDRGEGKGTGRQDMWAWVVAAVALLLALYAAVKPH